MGKVKKGEDVREGGMKALESIEDERNRRPKRTQEVKDVMNHT